MNAGSAPLITRESFRYYVTITEGSNVTLTAAVTDLPLSSGYPVWQVVHGMLPSTAKVDNYTNDGILYSNLSLYNLSYYEDSGNYTCTAIVMSVGCHLCLRLFKLLKVSCMLLRNH